MTKDRIHADSSYQKICQGGIKHDICTGQFVEEYGANVWMVS